MMNNLQLIKWAVRNRKLALHAPSAGYPFYTACIATDDGQLVLSDKDQGALCDAACEVLRQPLLLTVY